MHNGCDIANQMFSNGQLWTWPLIFEICWTRLLSLVVYIWSYLWFSFQVWSTQAVYSFTKWTAWGLAPNEDNRTQGIGRLKRLEHCELMNTYRSWWRYKTSIFRSFRFYLKSLRHGKKYGVSLKYQVDYWAKWRGCKIWQRFRPTVSLGYDLKSPPLPRLWQKQGGHIGSWWRSHEPL